MSKNQSASTRAAVAARERAAAGWSWNTNSRRRGQVVGLVLAAKGRTCHLCGLPGATTADHIVPRSKGGTNELENLAPAHSGCNTRRGNKTLAEWFATHPLRDRPTAAPSREW